MNPLFTSLLGAMLGAGLLLTASPLLWPAGRAVATNSAKAAPRSIHSRVLRSLHLAGLPTVTPVSFGVISAVLGLMAAGLAQALLGIVGLAIVIGSAGFLTPSLLVRWRVSARRKANRAVWPDVVDHLVSAVRSGLSLPDAVSSLAHAGPVTTRMAFAAFESDYKATAHFGRCVSQLKDRLADPVADRLLETLRMAREVGGTELTTVLRSLATYLREDAAVRSELHARQGWVVNAARLGVAAPWIVLLLLASRAEAAAAYNTSAGTVLILGGIAVSAVAYRIMLRVGKLPEEQRWFR